jgi:hypothetical protein
MKKLLAALLLWGALFGVCHAGIPPIPPPAPFNPVNSTVYTKTLDPETTPKFRLAVAKTRAGLGDTIIAVVGTSISAGEHDADSFTNAKIISRVHQLALMGVLGLPTNDDAWWGDMGAYGHGTTLPTMNPAITLTTWTGAGAVNTIGGAYMANASNANTICTQLTKPADTANLNYLTTTGAGAIEWNVDGGSYSAPISENAAKSYASTSISFGGLMNATTGGAHLVCVKASTNTGYFAGLDPYNSTRSTVRLWNMGFLGAKAYTSDNQACWSCTTFPYSPGNVLGNAPVTPNLCMIEVGVNDANQIFNSLETLVQYQTYLHTIVTNCQKSGDVVLIQSLPTATATTPQIYTNQVNAAIAAEAATDNVPLIQWTARVGGNYTNAVAQGWMSASTQYHGSTSSYTDEATFEQQVINQLAGTGSVNGPAATAQSASATPTAPASTSAYKMAGLGVLFTPTATGNVAVTVNGTITGSTVTAGDGVKYQLSYGTGAAPANAAALTGTQVGPVQTYTSPSIVVAADINVPFSLGPVVITGLTVGTQYWLDLAAESAGTVSSGNTSNVSISASELK